MYHTETSNTFGICQIGEWSTFNHYNIDSISKIIIDISRPIPTWIKTLQDIRNIFIVSQFVSQEDINSAIDLIRLCRNNFTFITVITSVLNDARNDLFDLKNYADIFLLVEPEYFENEKINDTMSYAIDFLAESFDEVIDTEDFEPWYDCPFYAFSQSGSAKLVVFKLLKADYEKGDEFQLLAEIMKQLSDKRLAFLHIKSGDDSRIWPKEAITKAVKKASGKMIYAGWRSSYNQEIGKKTWVTAEVSYMDNPQNSFTGRKNRTVFQGGR